MNRREFLSAGSAGLALSAKLMAEQAADQKPKRVGIIGPGWYGKSDLFRLIQVSPVEVVSMCDVDKQMLSQAAEMVASRQASKKTPRLFSDYREMLKEKDLDICLVDTPDHWHALPMIAAVQSGADVVGAEADLGGRRGRPEHGGGGAQARARGAGGHAAAQHAASDRSAQSDCPRRQARQGGAGGNLLLQRRRRRAGPARDGTARQPGLRNVDRPGADAALHSRQASARLAPVHGVRQRDARRHGHTHVRYGALVYGPGLAQAHQLHRRHHGEDRAQGEYCGHPNRDLRLRQPRNRVAAPLLGRPGARPQVFLGRHAVRRQGDAQIERVLLRFHAGRRGAGSQSTRT